VKPDVCRVCGSDAVRVAYGRVHDYITGEAFQVWQCGDCQVASTFPQPSNLDRYYPSSYRSFTRLASLVLRSLYKMRTRGWTEKTKRPGIAIELGCGDGAMLHSLKQRGWRVIGTERSTEVAAIARKTHGIPVYVGGLEAIRPEPCCDLIILFQVLEHIPDPLTTLRQCAKLLSPSGKLIIGVPNFDSWQSRYAGPAWFHLDVPRHLFHFSPVSLTNTLRLAGLAVTEISYVSFEHDPFGWIESIINKRVRVPNQITRHLMRMERSKIGVGLGLIAGILVVPSLAMSLLSWALNRGALIQVTCKRSDESN
jgi:SAM-dependent methyltransferase